MNRYTNLLHFKDLNSHRYHGPAYAAQAVARWFPNHWDIKIADVGAGSGRVGKEVRKLICRFIFMYIHIYIYM